MQKGPGNFARRVRRIRRNCVGELSQVFGQWLELPESFGNPGRKRLFFQSRTFWLFLSQVLSADQACREVVRKFLVWLGLKQGATASANTAAYCRARARLRQEHIEEANAQVLQKIEAKVLKENLWYGRSVKVIDGSGLSMPDTPENQEVYPQSRRQKRGCGFPTMRIVAMFSLSAGAILALAQAALEVSERALFRSLWPLLEPGDVALADCGFCGYAEFYYLLQRGVDSVMRNHPRRKVGLSELKRLGKGDRLIQWHKSRVCPRWPAKQDWLRIPDRLFVREIKFSVDIPGFRTKAITIATTLLDHKAFPKQAFLDLYRRRWMAELFLRDSKITMGMDVLRCKSPEMVHKELAMYQIAYNLIRALMLQAATSHDVPLERISFKGTVATARQWAPYMAAADLNNRERKWLMQLMLSYVAEDLLPRRPNR